MAAIRRTAVVLSIVASLVALSLLVGCSSQARPPGIQPSEVASITVWVRGGRNWDLEQRRVIDSSNPFEIEQFIEAWATLETLRSPGYPESPDGEAEVRVSLSEDRQWTLKWQPAYGEAVFRLYGEGTPEMVDRSPMKVESNEMLQLLAGWVGELQYPPPRPQ